MFIHESFNKDYKENVFSDSPYKSSVGEYSISVYIDDNRTLSSYIYKTEDERNKDFKLLIEKLKENDRR